MGKTHYTAVLYYYYNLMIESSLRLFSAPSLASYFVRSVAKTRVL